MATMSAVMWKWIQELWTHMVRVGSWGQWVCFLPAGGIEMVGVPQVVEHLCCLVHTLLLHRHIPTPFGNELAGLARKQGGLHEAAQQQMHTVRRCTRVDLIVQGECWWKRNKTGVGMTATTGQSTHVIAAHINRSSLDNARHQHTDSQPQGRN